MQICERWAKAYVHTFFVYLNSSFFLHSIRHSFASHIGFSILAFVFFSSFFFFTFSLSLFLFLLCTFILRFFLGRNKLSIQLMCWINTRMIFPCWPFLESRIYFYYFIRLFFCFNGLLLRYNELQLYTQNSIYTQYDLKI